MVEALNIFLASCFGYQHADENSIEQGEQEGSKIRKRSRERDPFFASIVYCALALNVIHDMQTMRATIWKM